MNEPQCAQQDKWAADFDKSVDKYYEKKENHVIRTWIDYHQTMKFIAPVFKEWEKLRKEKYSSLIGGLKIYWNRQSKYMNDNLFSLNYSKARILYILLLGAIKHIWRYFTNRNEHNRIMKKIYEY